MKKFHLFFFLLILLSIASGILFYCIQNNMLIIAWTWNPPTHKSSHASSSAKKNITLFFWHEEKFQQEKTTLVWEQDAVEKNMYNLLNIWITHLQEEKLINGKVRLQSVALTAHQDVAYIAFNRSFLSQEWSINKKWHFVESLGKTIRNAALPICFIVFIENGAIMKDNHLDFSQSWPIDGFLEDNK